MEKGSYSSTNLGCSETSDYDDFLKSIVVMTSTGSCDKYKVIVGSRVEVTGRTTTPPYRMLAVFRAGKTTLMKYFEKDPRVHPNDCDGRLDLKRETEDFAQSVSKSLSGKGLRVKKEGLVLKLSKD